MRLFLKKVLIVFCTVVLVAVSFSGCAKKSDKTILQIERESGEQHILKTMPEYEDGELWVYGNWMDFTVYGEYKFSDLNAYFKSDKNVYFKPVDDLAISQIGYFLKDYEQWVSLTENAEKSIGDDLTKVYRFDKDCMDNSDWYCYEKDTGTDTVYYFDTQTGFLYILHYDT